MRQSKFRGRPAVTQWVCPNCAKPVSSAYCPVCGEAPLHTRDLTLRGLLRQVAESFASIDGPLLRSFRCLLTRPGGLTVAYLRGQRKPYSMPLPIFLLANVLFFGMQSFTGAKIFSTPLDQHLQNDIWGSVAQRLVTHHLQVKQTTLTSYAPVFDRAVALNAKSMIVLMVPPFALLAAAVFYRRSRPCVTHIVFSLHFYAFLLLLLSVSLALVRVDRYFGGRGLESQSFDHVLSILELIACGIYLAIAAGTVYGSKGAGRILAALPLVLAVAVIFLGYRFVLLPITLCGT